MASAWPDKISILVPVYNSAETLGACVDSVLAEGDENCELILVDDGSADGGGALCDEYARRYPGLVRAVHQENRGLILARRRGIALAEGELCLFLDADDMLAAGSLQVIRGILAETDADIVLFNYDNLYETTGAVETDEVIFKDGSVFEGESKRRVYEEMIRGWRLNNLCMKAIKTALVREDDTPYKEYAHLRFGEDLLQSLYPITQAKRIVYCAKPLYIYRHARTSMIGGAARRRDESEAIIERLAAYMRLWDMDDPAMREVFAIRRINGKLAIFWQGYRAADGPEGRRALLMEDWTARLDPETRAYLKSPAIPFRKRLQLWAIRRKNRPLLWLLERFGGRKIRRQYGE